jgi:hypothetical protein
MPHFDLKRRSMSSLLRIASENESAHDAGHHLEMNLDIVFLTALGVSAVCFTLCRGHRHCESVEWTTSDELLGQNTDRTGHPACRRRDSQLAYQIRWMGLDTGYPNIPDHVGIRLGTL